MTVTWERIITSEPVDTLARVVTSPGLEYEVCSCGWEPGAFSRVLVPFIPDKMAGRVSGRVTVLGGLEISVKGWSLVCRCNCGNYMILRHRHIRHQSVRMCGECEAVRKMCKADRPERKKGQHFRKAYKV
jgi:hypothetical protein